MTESTNPLSTASGWPAGSLRRPRTLDLAVQLMYVGALLQTIGMFAAFAATDELSARMRSEFGASYESSGVSGADVDQTVSAVVSVALVIVVVLSLVSIGLWLWMAVMNGRGVEWARVVATIFGSIALVSSLWLLSGQVTGLSLVVNLLVDAVAAVTLVLLHTSSAKEYYATQSMLR